MAHADLDAGVSVRAQGETVSPFLIQLGGSPEQAIRLREISLHDVSHDLSLRLLDYGSRNAASASAWSAAAGELPAQELDRPVEGLIGGLGSVGFTGRFREPVAGARVAVERDLATSVPEPCSNAATFSAVSYGSSSAKCPRIDERAAARLGPETEP
jgi:hypothetical protein